MKYLNQLAIVALTVILSACGAMNPPPLDAVNVGQTATVRDGLVLAVDTVAVKPQQNYATAALGGTVGGALGTGLGSKIGQGRGRSLATTLAGLLGATAGAAVTQSDYNLGRQYLLQVSNQRVAVVLTSFDPSIRPGDRVLLIYHGSRVTRIQRA